jgi:hypothetical protein
MARRSKSTTRAVQTGLARGRVAAELARKEGLRLEALARLETAPERVSVEESGPLDPKPDETARERVGLLAGRAELDAREAKYRKLVADYGGNRRARRRARAEVDRDARRKR